MAMKAGSGYLQSNFSGFAIYLFDQGLNACQIGREVEVSPSTVSDWLKTAGRNLRRPQTRINKKLHNFKDKILEDYNNGKCYHHIAQEYNCAASAIARILKRANVFQSRTLYSTDSTFFNKIDTEEKAWILGLWYTDGFNHDVAISIRLIDLDIIQKIKEAISFTGKIYIVKPKEERYKIAYGIHVAGRSFSHQLDLLGCRHNKTFNLEFPDENILPRGLHKHFVRGLIDGDGWVADRQVGLCGASPLVLNFPEIVYSHLDITMRLYDKLNKESGNITHNQKITRILSIEKFLHWIYDDATVYGDRKYNAAQLIFDRRIKINNKTDGRKGANRRCLK